jgi:hypothetical protein
MIWFDKDIFSAGTVALDLMFMAPGIPACI